MAESRHTLHHGEHSRQSLFEAMVRRLVIDLWCLDGLRTKVRINSIEMEDSTGYNFNLGISHVRTDPDDVDVLIGANKQTVFFSCKEDQA